jgi:hypothetical protein
MVGALIDGRPYFSQVNHVGCPARGWVGMACGVKDYYAVGFQPDPAAVGEIM